MNMPAKSLTSARELKAVNLRVREDTRALIDKAASIQGRSRTDFMIEASRHAAEEAILDLLALKFPTAIPSELVALLRNTTNLAQLNRWLAAAAKSNTLEDFQALVNHPSELNGY